MDRAIATGMRLAVPAQGGAAYGTAMGGAWTVERSRYATLYGPTKGVRVRLADTDLLFPVTENRCRGPRQGRGGVRRGQGDPGVDGPGSDLPGRRRPDLVITGAIVLDHWGVVKAGIGVRDGRIVGLGKAGNPDIMDGVHPALVIGPGTEVIAGNGMILTVGAVDSHVHLISPQQVPEALGSGVSPP